MPVVIVFGSVGDDVKYENEVSTPATLARLFSIGDGGNSELFGEVAH